MNYSDFTLMLDNTVGRFYNVLEYDDFSIYKDTYTKKYYYLEGGENDASDLYEVIPVAQLSYDINHDLLIKDGASLSALFDCDCCGEEVTDKGITYWWFKKKN